MGFALDQPPDGLMAEMKKQYVAQTHKSWTQVPFDSLSLSQRYVISLIIITQQSAGGLGYKVGFVFHVQSQIAVEALRRMPEV